MKYKSIDLTTAARETIDNLTAIGGEGGIIAVDTNGNISLPFNSEGMYRGYIRDGQPVTEIYR
jgi:beta-aspartyl-peptidase (threonine type)